MKFRPDFNDLWGGPWEHEPSAGVGLRFSGYPSDEAKFIGVLQSESCNPVACRRILLELRTKGEKFTTVMSFLPFNNLAREFKALGVNLEVVEPVEIPDTCSMDAVALSIAVGAKIPTGYDESILQEGIRRAGEVGFIPHETLGPYSHVLKDL